MIQSKKESSDKMNLWTLKDLANICNGYILNGDENTKCNNFSKDTRTITVNDVYIGIKGETFDGNAFYDQAFLNGASACILEESFKDKITDNTHPILIVKDSIEALRLMAVSKLKEYNIPVVAVTGSVGKTSTKEMIYSVMSKKYKVLKTVGNENNDIGLPLTILRLKDHTAAIIEMGMNHLNEISYLSKIATPDIAVITNVTSAHIGNLGSMENILKAKLEIIAGLKENGTLIINNDNDYLKTASIKVDKFTCGIKQTSDLQATDIKFKNDMANFNIKYNNQNYHFNCNFKTEPFILNSLLAIAVGIKLNIELSDIQEAIANLEITKGRLEVINLDNNITLINDAYNASIASVKNAIDYLKNTKGERKIAILGDIFELGNYSQDIHSSIGKYVAINNIDYLITIGSDAKYIYQKAINSGMNENKIKYFNKKEDSYEFLKSFIKPNDTIIVKASNAMGFKDIVEYIKKNI